MRVLVSGAGGAAAVSFFKSVSYLDLNIHMADIDPLAVGLYLVPEHKRHIVKKGSDLNFVNCLLEVCVKEKIDVLIPTVDCELVPIAQNMHKFRANNIKVPISTENTLATCLDKYALMQCLTGIAPLAKFELYKGLPLKKDWIYPVIAKPRTGSGGRGIKYINHESELDSIPSDGSYLIQEFLPGEEYSVDTYMNQSGFVVSAVIRARLKTDSGVAVASCTIKDKELESAASEIARNLNLRYVSNIQFKRDLNGSPKLLEINPRFPGTMPLTVGAGVNMPELCLRELNNKLENIKIDYEEIAVVRYWAEKFVTMDEFVRA
ncbi:ATP-grasp domain-containing protein [Kangiella sp. HZ709]|uniref:ATP-grasp domain-containing protein n=1 Tax=Kangiella sp. HZ709 TaxID=2666328 RepID=UPI0012AF41D6|nr:ATP-grasp domain-containing protein [Kangiella sp. HZ709]MRX27257.1 ATP-grasp domain-containing protein [Kangiella sp. HZ709]